ncbi:hypothetical protein EBU99_02205 [bacterium]|nr:hypothetical protein [bacterium]
MPIQQHNELLLTSGQTTLSFSPATGKITRCVVQGNNLFVEPHADEWQRALTDENRQSFESLDAWGADECFPTVAGSQLWNLRDHGSVWAKTPSVLFAHENQCSIGWQQKDGRTFNRVVKAHSEFPSQRRLGAFALHTAFPNELSLADSSGQAESDFAAISVYASHALFQAQPQDRIEWGFIAGVTTLESLLNKVFTYEVLAARKFAPDQRPVASKFYLRTSATKLFFTSLIREQLGIRIDVIQDASLPWVGLWWCHNGWGDGRPHSTVGIEPTNLPSDGPVLGFKGLEPPEQVAAQFLWIVSKI